MKILLLGGTRFLGRHIAEQALQAGHELTLLHRGRSDASLFPQARHLIADRNESLAVLDGTGTWDVAIDTNAYVPRHVRQLARQLAGRVGRYHLVSSISVYDDLGAPGVTESAPFAMLADPAVEDVTGATYGGLKRLCELAALEAFGADRVLLPRPGLIVGPHDPTGRFSWWVQRLLRKPLANDVLVPGPRDAALQFIDARDAAAWMLRQAGDGTTGAFNLTGPAVPLSFGAFFDEACHLLNPQARLRWVDGEWLQREGVTPWSELPLWVGSGSPGLHAVDISRALATGFSNRPVAQTLTDTAAWLASNPPPPAEGAMARPAVGMSAEREHELLQRSAAGAP